MRGVRTLLATVFVVFRDLVWFVPMALRSQASLRVENLVLRKQLAFYQEHKIKPKRLSDAARLTLVLWSRFCDWRNALVIVKPDTLIGWHRKGFKLFWRWKSNPGRPALKLGFARRVLAGAQSDTPLHVWQRRFYDFNVWTERKRIEKLRYMHRNPVKRGLVDKPEDWKWSSFRFYAYGEAGLVQVNEWRVLKMKIRAAKSPAEPCCGTSPTSRAPNAREMGHPRRGLWCKS